MSQIFRPALIKSLPIFFIYFPLGLLFGLMVENANFPWWQAPMMSIFAYGPSLQFLSLNLITTSTPYISILTAGLFLALKNSFYILGPYPKLKKASPLTKAYLCFSMVDAPFGLLMQKFPVKEKHGPKYAFILSLLIHFYWIGGSLVGSLFGRFIPEIPGLEFLLTSLFFILAVEQYIKVKTSFPFLMAILLAISSFLVLGRINLTLSIGMALIICAFYRIPDISTKDN